MLEVKISRKLLSFDQELPILKKQSINISSVFIAGTSIANGCASTGGPNFFEPGARNQAPRKVRVRDKVVFLLFINVFGL